MRQDKLLPNVTDLKKGRKMVLKSIFNFSENNYYLRGENNLEKGVIFYEKGTPLFLYRFVLLDEFPS
jgi:hypothetical protein